MTVLDNLLTGRHSRIRTNPLAEMLFLPSVRREEMRQREAVEKIIDFVELERYRHARLAVCHSASRRSSALRARLRSSRH